MPFTNFDDFKADKVTVRVIAEVDDTPVFESTYASIDDAYEEGRKVDRSVEAALQTAYEEATRIEGFSHRDDKGGMLVYCGNTKLDPAPSLKLRNHSPDGFAWGYSGSGPAQLALAMLLHFTDQDFALANYQQFKTDVIATLDKEGFEMDETEVAEWCKNHGLAQSKLPLEVL